MSVCTIKRASTMNHEQVAGAVSSNTTKINRLRSVSFSVDDLFRSSGGRTDYVRWRSCWRKILRLPDLRWPIFSPVIVNFDLNPRFNCRCSNPSLMVFPCHECRKSQNHFPFISLSTYICFLFQILNEWIEFCFGIRAPSTCEPSKLKRR